MSRLRVLAVATAAAVLGALLVPAVPALADGVSYQWLGGVSGLWTDAGNWSPNGVPGTGDSVVIDPPYDARCNTHISGIPDVELADLTVDEHAYQGNPDSACLTSLDDGAITVDHTFAFHAGDIASTFTLAAGATGTITPNIVHDKSHFGGPVTIQGALTLSGNTGTQQLSLTSSPSMTIAAGGSLTTQGDNVVSADCCDTTAHLINNGTMSLGAGTLTADAVEVDQNAVLAAPSGAQLVTDFAPQTMGAGAKYQGAGSWIQQLGTITMSGTQTLSGGFHWILGGHGTTSEEYLVGKASVTGTGSFEWAGGQIGAALTLGHNITAFADGADGVDTRQLDGLDQSVSPAKTVTLTVHGPLSFTNGAGFSGVETGRLTVASDGTLNLDPGTSVDHAIVTNSGGAVAIPAGATCCAPVDFDVAYKATGGTTSLAPNSTLLLDDSDPSLLSGTTVTGGGTLAVAAPITLTGTTTVDTATTLNVQKHGAVTSSGTAVATVSGPGVLAWTGGSFTGKVVVSTAGGQKLSGTTDVKSVVVPTGKKGVSLTLSGPSSIAAGSASTDDQVDVDAGATLTFGGSLSLAGHTEINGGKVITNGATSVRAGTSKAFIGSSTIFTNNGNLSVFTGILHSDADLVQASGSTTLAAGTTLELGFSSTQFRLQGGKLAGTGTVQGIVNNTGGTVSPGGTAIGTLSVNGSYTSGAAATVLADIGPGGSDLLAVTGSATLGGTLIGNDASGYVPAAGATATVVTGSSITKRLTCVQTTGAGAATEHWSAKALNGALVLTSVDGMAPPC